MLASQEAFFNIVGIKYNDLYHNAVWFSIPIGQKGVD